MSTGLLFTRLEDLQPVSVSLFMFQSSKWYKTKNGPPEVRKGQCECLSVESFPHIAVPVPGLVGGISQYSVSSDLGHAGPLCCIHWSIDGLIQSLFCTLALLHFYSPSCIGRHVNMCNECPCKGIYTWRRMALLLFPYFIIQSKNFHETKSSPQRSGLKPLEIGHLVRSVREQCMGTRRGYPI